MKPNYTAVDALGTAKFLIMGEKFGEARQALDLVRPFCNSVPQLDAIGKIYSEAKDFNSCYEIACQLYSMVDEKNRNNVRQSMIRSLLNLNRPAEALAKIQEHYYQNIPDDDLEMDRALALFLLNRKSESESVLKGILSRTKDVDTYNRVKFNLGIHEIANGQFLTGLEHFILYGRKLGIWKPADMPSHNEWRGGAVPGATVVIFAEGGIGDEIINVRFMKYFDKMGMKALWYTPRKDLAEVFRRNGFEVITDLSQYNPSWLWTYSMSLPIYLSIEEDLLWDGPYLKAIKGEPLPLIFRDDIDRIKIGIKTHGNPLYEQDLHRSIPWHDLLDAFPLDKTSVYNLNLEAFRKNPNGTEYAWWVRPLGPTIKTWEETLSYLDQLDMVVTSCTSIAHAASAMGKKTIVLVPILNYYVWAKLGSHSPWYSENTIILRQTEPNNWDEPIRQLKEILSEQKY